MRKIRKKIIYLVLILPFLLVIISNYTIEKYSDGKTTDDISKIKNNKVGLVLGTSKTYIPT